MNWVKRHRLWSLIFLYLGVGILVGSLLDVTGVADGGQFNRFLGMGFLPYLYCCKIILNDKKKQKATKVQSNDEGGKVT